MKNKVCVIYMFILVVIFARCGMDFNRSKIESCLNTTIESTHKCYFAQYVYEDGCPISTLFRIDGDSSYYNQLVSNMGLVTIDKKKAHLNEFSKYDREFNNSLWLPVTHYPYKLSWWVTIDDDSVLKNKIAGHYYYKDGSIIAIGNKHQWNGHITMCYYKNAIYGIIETRCEVSNSID